VSSAPTTGASSGRQLVRKKLPLCTCTLRSPSAQADAGQPCHIAGSVFKKAIQEGNSLEKTLAPSLDLT